MDNIRKINDQKISIDEICMFILKNTKCRCKDLKEQQLLLEDEVKTEPK